MATIDPTHPSPGAEAPPAAETPTESVAAIWWVLLATGILTMLAGIAVLVWPGATLLVIAVLFGARASSSVGRPSTTGQDLFSPTRISRSAE